MKIVPRQLPFRGLELRELPGNNFHGLISI